MGAVESKIDEQSQIVLRDQGRCKVNELSYALVRVLANGVAVAITNVTVTNARNKVLVVLEPNGNPASSYRAGTGAGDNTLVEFVQVRSR